MLDFPSLLYVPPYLCSGNQQLSQCKRWVLKIIMCLITKECLKGNKVHCSQTCFGTSFLITACRKALLHLLPLQSTTVTGLDHSAPWNCLVCVDYCLLSPFIKPHFIGFYSYKVKYYRFIIGRN